MANKTFGTVCIAAAVSLGGCGGGSDQAAAPPRTVTTTVTVTTTTATATTSEAPGRTTTIAPTPRPTPSAPSPALTGTARPDRAASQCNEAWTEAVCAQWVAGKISTKRANQYLNHGAVTDPTGAICKREDVSAGGYCYKDGKSSGETQTDWQAVHDKKAARCRARGGLMSGEDCLTKGSKGYKEEKRRRSESPDFYQTYPDGQNYGYCPDGTPTQDPSACKG